MNIALLLLKIFYFCQPPLPHKLMSVSLILFIQKTTIQFENFKYSLCHLLTEEDQRHRLYIQTEGDSIHHQENQTLQNIEQGKLSKSICKKHMEFSICWLTPPPPNIWKICNFLKMIFRQFKDISIFFSLERPKLLSKNSIQVW